MRSVTKTSLSEEQVKELARRAFPDGPIGVVKELTAGMFNAAYLVEVPGSVGQVVLKVAVGPGAQILTYERGILDTEIAVMELLSSKTALPVPTVLAAMPAGDVPAHFFMTYVPGKALSKMRGLRKRDRESLHREVGDALGQTNSLKGEYFGYPAWYAATRPESWRGTYERMIDDVLADASAFRVDAPSARIRHTVERAAGLLEEVTEPRLVNFDMWPGNILVERDSNGAHVSGFIDFERAFWGDPLFDFASVDPMRADAWSNRDLWTAYADARDGGVSPQGPNPQEQARIWLGELYLWTIIAVESYRYPKLYGRLQRTGALKKLTRIMDRLDKVT